MEGLNSIKDKLNHIDISGIVMYDPECIVGEKQFYESVFYSNIHPQEAVSFTDKMQLITKSIKLITDRTELDYLLGEIKDIKLLAKKSHDKIGRASCRKECTSWCSSWWSLYK